MRYLLAFAVLAAASVGSAPTPAAAHDVIMEPAPRRPVVYTERRHRPRHRIVGFHGSLHGVFSSDLSLGGFSGALRVRPVRSFAVDIGAGFLAGTDVDESDRIEIPAHLDLYWFINPHRRAQFYLTGGMFVSYASVETLDFERLEFAHAGVRGGAGVEFRMSPGFAVNADLRIFARERIDNEPYVEFLYGDDEPTVGGTVSVGGTFYF